MSLSIPISTSLSSLIGLSVMNSILHILMILFHFMQNRGLYLSNIQIVDLETTNSRKYINFILDFLCRED